MNQPTNKENFLIEVTPALYDRIKQELSYEFVDENVELHYSPYWKEMKNATA